MGLAHHPDSSDANFAPESFAKLFSDTQIGQNFRSGDEEPFRFGRLVSSRTPCVLLPRGIVVASATPDLVVARRRSFLSFAPKGGDCTLAGTLQRSESLTNFVCS